MTSFYFKPPANTTAMRSSNRATVFCQMYADVCMGLKGHTANQVGCCCCCCFKKLVLFVLHDTFKATDWALTWGKI